MATPAPAPIAADQADQRPSVRCRARDGWALLTWSGDIDLAALPVCVGSLDAVASRCGAGLVLDLSGVTFLDSTGLVLLDEVLRIVPAGADLRLLPPAGRARRVLELSGALAWLPVVDDESHLPTAVLALRAEVSPPRRPEPSRS